MKKKGSTKSRKRLILLSIVFLGITGFSFASVFRDWMQIMDNKQQIASLTTYYNELLDEEESLTSEVTKLHDSDYVARYAREKYMYSLPGEYIIKVPDENGES